MNPAARLARLFHDDAVRTVAANTSWLIAGRLGTQAIMLLFNILLARRLGETGVGVYTFFTGLIFLVNTATSFGTDMILVREIAANKDFTRVSAAATLQISLSLPVIALFFLLNEHSLNLSSDGMAALRLYSLTLLPLALFGPASAVLRAVERMDTLMWLNLLLAGMQLGLATVVIHTGSSLRTLALVLLAAQVMTTGVALIVTGYVAGWKTMPFRLKPGAVRSLMWQGLPVGLLTFMTVFYQRVMIYLLTLISGAEVTGWYAVAAKMVDTPKVVLYAVLGALLPQMARVYASSTAGPEERGLFQWAFTGMVLFSALVSLGLFVLAPLLTSWLFGPGFAPSSKIMRHLAFVLVPFAISNYFATRLFAAGHETQVLSVIAVAAVLLTGLSLWVVPIWGAVGGATTTLVMECLLAAGLVVLWHTIYRPSVGAGNLDEA